MRVLEDHPRFNAGRGSVLTTAGTVEMDASIMEGDTLDNGAVALRVRGPESDHARPAHPRRPRPLLFVGAGPSSGHARLGVPLCDPAALVTDRQRQRRLARGATGHVGAVAIDRFGTIVAGTSTGGRRASFRDASATRR